MSKPKIELWKPIPDFEGYQISNWGRLKLKETYDEDNSVCRRGIRVDGKPKRKEAKISKNKTNDILLSWSGQKKWFKRGQLVLLAFVGPPPSDEEANARHLNDNPEQNWPSNLAWGTSKDNHNDGVRNGRHSTKGSEEALRYGAPLKGKQRPKEVVEKIRRTKQMFPERQFYGNKKDPKTGRFVS